MKNNDFYGKWLDEPLPDQTLELKRQATRAQNASESKDTIDNSAKKAWLIENGYITENDIYFDNDNHYPMAWRE
ncbi:hypothetical protein [Photobacterium damselae]|uniref:hypothetical protein n=1 Tax=Photobacterium damselae TaxID=38293 RepID=UPI00370CD1BE